MPKRQAAQDIDPKRFNDIVFLVGAIGVAKAKHASYKSKSEEGKKKAVRKILKGRAGSNCYQYLDQLTNDNLKSDRALRKWLHSYVKHRSGSRAKAPKDKCASFDSKSHSRGSRDGEEVRVKGPSPFG